MMIIQIWQDFLAHTMPSVSGSLAFVYLQMGIGAMLPLMTLYHTIRRENKWETILVCMVPFILITTVAIMEPLFFGAFLGEGFTEVEPLRAFLLQPEFFKEASFLSGLFILAALLYLGLEQRQGGIKAARVFLNMGVELVFALGVLVVGIDYARTGGALFLALGDILLKWYVYGLYLLLNKSCFFLLCLFWSLLFSEQERADERGYWFDHDTWLRRYLTKSYRVIGIGLTLFGVFFAYVVVYQLYLEERALTSLLLTMIVLNSFLLVPGVFCLLAAIFPWCMPNYRRILTWGDPEETAKLIYEELTQDEPYVQMDAGLSTRHFLVLWIPYKRIYYWPQLVSCEHLMGGVYRLCFQDGSHCRLNDVYRPLIPSDVWAQQERLM